MKISLNWVKQFTDVELSVDELVKKIGAQLGAVEEVIDLGAKYQDIIIAEIAEKRDHPNADKLAVYQANVGREELVQVVCGDKDLQVGNKVAWIQPGAVVPSTYGKEPFTMESRPLRGEISNGMFGSSAELLFSDNHGRVLVLDTSAEPGTPFADAYQLNDYIIDVENKMFTHRPDCFGTLGVAREIAGIQNRAFKSPDWYLKSLDRIKPGKTKLPLEVKNEAGDLVPRFMAIAMADVKIGDSPLIIQSYLSRVGLKPINNIVDVTNYLMMLTGQPLHAYDYDKVKERSGDVPVLIARKAAKDEKIKLLNGKELAFEDPVILIATDKEPVGVGGIMGGADTEVDENTKNIILECANFDMYSIRKTAMKYGLFTDAVTRFNKGQSPLQNDIVLEEAVATVQYVSGGHVASDVYDLQDQEPSIKNLEVKVTSDFINARLGLKLPAEDMAHLLKNVEFTANIHGDELSVTPPFWRTDIEIPEDIVEEVGRLYGFDHLPLVLPKRSIKPAKRDELLELKSRIRDVLSRAGANEVLTYSFVHGNLLEKVGQDKDMAFEISNALSPDLQYYRLSLTPSLLEKVRGNIKAGYGEFAMFEIGKVHGKGLLDEENVPRELNRIALVFAASPKAEKSYTGAAYFQAKAYLQKILDTFVEPGVLVVKPLEEADFGGHTLIQHMTTPFNPKRAAVLVKGDLIVGVVGEYRSDVARSLKLPALAAGFEIFHSFLMGGAAADSYTAISKFPKVEQDISLRVSESQAYQPVFGELLAGLQELSGESLQTTLTPLDIYQKDNDKHFTFRLSAAHHGKTLKATEINSLLDKLADRAKQKFNAERI